MVTKEVHLLAFATYCELSICQGLTVLLQKATIVKNEKAHKSLIMTDLSFVTGWFKETHVLIGPQYVQSITAKSGPGCFVCFYVPLMLDN